MFNKHLATENGRVESVTAELGKKKKVRSEKKEGWGTRGGDSRGKVSKEGINRKICGREKEIRGKQGGREVTRGDHSQKTRRRLDFKGKFGGLDRRGNSGRGKKTKGGLWG